MSAFGHWGGAGEVYRLCGNGTKIDRNILNDTQALIEKKLYGDLLRGFWTK